MLAGSIASTRSFSAIQPWESQFFRMCAHTAANTSNEETEVCRHIWAPTGVRDGRIPRSARRFASKKKDNDIQSGEYDTRVSDNV